MEPLAALAVGANILQIIDFGVELVKLTKDVIGSGETYDNHRLHQISSDLGNLVRDLSDVRGENNNVQSAPNDKPTVALKSLAQECENEATAIISKLDSFRPREKNSGKISRGSALKMAVLTMWNQSEIDAMALRLDRYRSHLGLRMLDIMNARSINQGASIVEILSLTQTIDSSVRTIAALLRNGDGSVNTILGDAHPSQSIGTANTLSVTYQDRSATSKTQGVSELYKHYVAMTEVPFVQVAQKIINSLWFASIHSRVGTIYDPFEKTLSWISGQQIVEESEWDSFPDWLRTGTGCYCIRGKAGSGKSTLMKYIAEHPLLAKHLQTWAGHDQLLKASFFFWRLGPDPLQRSQEGLLRSLLLQILDRRRDLITVCFPTLCRTLASTNGYREELKISFDELKVAFTLLAKHHLPRTKVFLLIDGLDEYQGDHRNLVELLFPAMESPVMKVLVSSRPEPLLLQAYNRCPGLEIHNLTHSDIEHYAEKNLRSDNTLAAMERLEPGISQQLIDTVVLKASGVFLWVKIVVRDLLFGLAHNDSLEALLREVDKFPEELEALYDYMFTSMSPTYRQEASRMMRLLKRSQEVQYDYPMTALQLVFAQMLRTGGPQDIPRKVLTIDEEKDHCELIEGRLRSRCCGLVEVQRSSWGPEDPRRYVGFLHRTVLDYLEREVIHMQLLDWDSTSASIDDILFSSCVMEIRQYQARNSTRGAAVIQPHGMPAISRRSRRIPSTATRILHALALRSVTRPSNDKSYEAIIKELAQTFLALPEPEHEEINERALARAIHPFLHVLGFTPTDTSQGFWMYAAVQGTGFATLASAGTGFHDAQCRSLAFVNNLLHLSHPLSGVSLDRVASGVGQLLIAGADPNEPCLFFDSIETANAPEEIKAAVRLAPNRENTLSPWIYWLSCKKHKSPIIERDYLLYIRILADMLTAGASLQGYLGSTDPKVKERVSGVVEHCIEAIPAAGKEAQDLRSQVRVIVCDVTASSPPTKDFGPLRRASKSWKIPLRLGRKKRSDTT